MDEGFTTKKMMTLAEYVAVLDNILGETQGHELPNMAGELWNAWKQLGNLESVTQTCRNDKRFVFVNNETVRGYIMRAKIICVFRGDNEGDITEVSMTMTPKWAAEKKNRRKR